MRVIEFGVEIQYYKKKKANRWVDRRIKCNISGTTTGW